MNVEKRKRTFLLARSLYRFFALTVLSAPSVLLAEEKRIFTKHREFVSDLEKTPEFEYHLVKHFIENLKEDLNENNSLLKIFLLTKGVELFLENLEKVLKELSFDLSPEIEKELNHNLFETISEHLHFHRMDLSH